MQNVQNLISQGKLKDAIQVLMDNNVDGAILLMGRINRLEKDSGMGILSRQEESMERAKIAAATLHYAGIDSDDMPPQSKIVEHSASGGLESTLQKIAAETKRRNQVIYEKAKAILDKFREYKDTKNENKLFDPNGRRLKAIELEADALIKEVSESKGDSREEFVSKVESLLSEAIPSYENLNGAYKLASARGFKDAWIEQQLNHRTNDNEVRITIAEKIEGFVSTV